MNDVFQFLRCDFLKMFEKIAKHRANDASLTMHRTPLPESGHQDFRPLSRLDPSSDETKRPRQDHSGKSTTNKTKTENTRNLYFQEKQQKMEPCSMGGDAAAGTSATTVKSCGISRTFSKSSTNKISSEKK